MANHVSHGSLPYPIKNARYTLLVPYLDADGDPTDPTTPDTELSGDGGSFADCAEEVSTITGSNGMGYLTLSGAEMNYSLVALAAKVASGPKATLATLYPRNLPTLSSGTLSAGSAGGGTLGTILAYDITGCFIRTTGGTGGGGTGGANNQARRIASYTPSTGAFTVSPNWETTPDNTTTYDILLPEGVTVGMLKTLNPTTEGRTLDVSSGGEAGVDWANVGSPTTTVNLSGTTVKTATDVEADTADIQSRLPAALDAHGFIKSDPYGWNGAVILESTGDVAGMPGVNVVRISADETAADNLEKVLDGTGGVTLAGNLSGSVGSVTGSVAGSVGSVTGSVGGSVNSVVSLNANTVNASALAADAVAEIADAIWDEARAGHTTAGTFGEYVNARITGTLQTLDALWVKIKKWLQLLVRNDAGIATDNATELTEINADEGNGAGDYDNTGESLQAHSVSLATYAASLAGQINDLIYSSTILETTVSAATSNTVFELTGGSTSDDVYVDHFVVLQQVGTPANRMVGKISAYAGATKEITLQADPGLFTVSIGDTVYILSEQVSAGGGLDAAGVRAAVGLASANLDDQLTALTAPFMKMYVWSTVDTATTAVIVLDAPLVNIDGTVTPDSTSFVGWYLVITNLTDYWQARPVATFDGATEFEVMSEYSDTPPTGAFGILLPPGFDMQSARDAMTLAISSFAAGAATGSVDDKLNDLQTDVTSIQTDTNDIQTRLPAALVSGRMDSNVQAMADNVITAAKIAADAIGASEIAAGAFDADAFTTALAEKIADVILRRQMDNVEGSTNGDALDKSSLYGLIQQAQESNTVDNAGELTIYKTDGVTELGRLTLDTDAAAEPVTGVS